MSLMELSSSERDIALQCLHYLLESDCLDDEFETRLGLTRAELAMVISKWPHLDDNVIDHVDSMAINNSFNEVCHGLRFTDEEWHQWFSVSRNAVCAAFDHWRQTENL